MSNDQKMGCALHLLVINISYEYWKKILNFGTKFDKITDFALSI